MKQKKEKKPKIKGKMVSRKENDKTGNKAKKKKKKEFNIYDLKIKCKCMRRIPEFKKNGAKDCIAVFKSRTSFMGLKKDLGLTMVRDSEVVYTSKANCKD